MRLSFLPRLQFLILLHLLLLLHDISPAGGYDLGLFEPAPVAERRPGLQIALYKYYSKIYSIPNLDARRPDLVTWLPQLNQPGRFGTWPEVYALNATPPQGFERYDGRTYGECEDASRDFWFFFCLANVTFSNNDAAAVCQRLCISTIALFVPRV